VPCDSPKWVLSAMDDGGDETERNWSKAVYNRNDRVAVDRTLTKRVFFVRDNLHRNLSASNPHALAAAVNMVSG